MDNRIVEIEVRDRCLMPAEAEVWVRATVEHPTPTTELRGRLMGPRCPYANTVEVAYPLRPLPPGQTPEASALVRRAVIPEACLWEPESPFLYQGPVELWQDGQRREQRIIRHGLRSFQLGERGLRINSRPLTLRGQRIHECTDEEALILRQAGCNLLVAPVREDTLPLWERADRLGFLMLGIVASDKALSPRRLEMLSRQPSCLGWLVENRADVPLPPEGLVGWMGDSPPSERTLSTVHFLAGPLEWANLGKPLLVTGEAPAEPPPGAVILGGIA